MLRRKPLRFAAPGSSAKVALIVEPRRHANLEHVLRNAAYFLGGRGWQLQLVCDDEEACRDHLRSLFTEFELECVQLLPLGVDNLTRRAYSELMCSHWLWERVVAESVLVFQSA